MKPHELAASLKRPGIQKAEALDLAKELLDLVGAVEARRLLDAVPVFVSLRGLLN